MHHALDTIVKLQLNCPAATIPSFGWADVG
jgi:hypothetical protein